MAVPRKFPVASRELGAPAEAVREDLVGDRMAAAVAEIAVAPAVADALVVVADSALAAVADALEDLEEVVVRAAGAAEGKPSMVSNSDSFRSFLTSRFPPLPHPRFPRHTRFAIRSFKKP